MGSLEKGSLKMVVFDIGGVLIQLAKDFKEACSWAKVNYRPFEITPSMEKRLVNNEKKFETGSIEPDNYYIEIHDILGGLYTFKEVKAIYMAYIGREFAGIKDIITTLKDKGYVTACLSNTCISHWHDLVNPEKYPAIAELDYQFASFEMGMAKPNIKIYKEVEKEVKMNGSAILFFDDREENVLVARKCQWNAILINQESSPVEQIIFGLQKHEVLNHRVEMNR